MDKKILEYVRKTCQETGCCDVCSYNEYSETIRCNRDFIEDPPPHEWNDADMEEIINRYK